jgi:hypothetical protein
MALASRDRISVDLRGLKVALLERARARGSSPSEFVRMLLADALGGASAEGSEALRFGVAPGPIVARTRLSLRMHRDDAHSLIAAARSAEMPLGSFVAGLLAGIPALHDGASPRQCTPALVASNAELATLSRNLHHLTSLLRHGSVRAAQEYRSMLETLDADVRNHLALASDVLAQLQPTRRLVPPGLIRPRARQGESHG